MIFTAPAALILLAALPLLLLLHLLLRKLHQREISSLLLWERILKRRRKALSSPRILNSLAVLLQAAAVVLIALAAAQPALRLTLPGYEGGTIILVDLSASMAARSGDSTRVEEARRLALSELGRARPPYTLATIEEEAQILLDGVRSAAEIARGIRELEPLPVEADTEAAVEGVLAGLGRKGDRELRVYTDRPQPGYAGRARNLSWHQIGRPGSNRGILSLSARPNSQGFILQSTLANFSDERTRLNLEIRLDDSALNPRTLELEAGETRELLLQLPPDSRRLRASLSGADLLPFDDQAELSLQPDPIRTELIGPLDPFLEAALGALERGALIRIMRPSEFAGRPSELRIITESPRAERENIFVPSIRFGVYPPSLGIEKRGLIEAGAALSWEETYPPDLFRLARADLVSLPSSATPIFTVRSMPVVTRLREGGGHIIFHFRLPDSDLPLREGFPLLLSRAVQELGGLDREPLIYRADLPGPRESELRTGYPPPGADVEAESPLRPSSAPRTDPRSFPLLGPLALLAFCALAAEAYTQVRRWME